MRAKRLPVVRRSFMLWHGARNGVITRHVMRWLEGHLWGACTSYVPAKHYYYGTFVHYQLSKYNFISLEELRQRNFWLLMLLIYSWFWDKIYIQTRTYSKCDWLLLCVEVLIFFSLLENNRPWYYTRTVSPPLR